MGLRNNLQSDTDSATQAITKVILRYCRAMDRIDAQLGYTVWHEDGTADFGEAFKGSGRGFIDWVCVLHRTFDNHFHQVGNILLDVDGERATSETYVTVSLLATKDAQKLLTTSYARYVDRWSCRGGRWAIDHRQFLLDFYCTRPVDAQPGSGRRDATDLSYAILGRVGRAS
jgi:hypothetical protein